MDLAKWTGKIKKIPGKLKGAFGAFANAMVNAFDALTGCFHRNKRSAGTSEAPGPAEAPVPEDDGNESRGFPSGRIDAFTDRFLHRLPEEKRKPVFYGLGGLVALFFILIIVFLAVGSGKSGKTASRAISAGPVIPQEDLFMPAEPGFLPAFLLERDPRHSWSVEDIRPYWKSPEKTGRWQEEIKSAVDKLMEGVP